MKKKILYAVIGFFLPFAVAWMFVLLFGATAPNEYAGEGKAGLGSLMCFGAFIGIMLTTDPD